MDRLIELGIPIIEDCCTAFFSQDKNSRIGMYGDFSIYSFPKFFPIQIGGLIVSKKAIETKKSKIAHSTKQYVLNVLSYYLKNKKEILQSREQIYNYTKNLFETYGFEARIKESINEVPSVFLFRNNGKISNLDALKLFLTRHGIQCSVFYGEDSFYIPSNQKLEFTDVDYFLFLVLNFIQKQNDN
jgi:dTDP-4-amino-4,6-dideoxygalactose transaminase